MEVCIRRLEIYLCIKLVGENSRKIRFKLFGYALTRHTEYNNLIDLSPVAAISGCSKIETDDVRFYSFTK